MLTDIVSFVFNRLNAELNPICHLLALLGAHHILHVSRIRVNRLTMCTKWMEREIRYQNKTHTESWGYY